MRKIKWTAFMLVLFLAIGGVIVSFSFQSLTGAEREDQNQKKEIQQLRYEWHRLAADVGKEADPNPECCVIEPCTYCLFNKEDGVCTCASDLSSGKKPCPECLGKWLNGQGSMHAGQGFQRVYPRLASWLVSQEGSSTLCPMMSGRDDFIGRRTRVSGGMMSGRGGSMGMMRGRMGMMRGMRRWFGRRSRSSSDSLKGKQIDLKMKARELKLLSDYNCCMTGGGSCTYCILDPQSTAKTVCDCKDRLKVGREVCPECFGVWASGEWNPKLEEQFQRTYPLLSRLIPKSTENLSSDYQK